MFGKYWLPDKIHSVQFKKKVKDLKNNEVLVIINNFEPIPLIKLLEKQGFLSHENYINEDRIDTYFYRDNNATNTFHTTIGSCTRDFI
jgi:uncharacterized protein (DUF2249 family)